MKMGRQKYKNVYAIYKGDMFLAEGTIKELAKELNIKEKTAKWYTSKPCRRRAELNDNLRFAIYVGKENEL